MGIHFLALVCLLAWTAASAKAQTNFGYTIYYDGVWNGADCDGTTYGFGVCLSPPVSSSFSSPNGLALDLAGNLYIADTGNNRILKVAAGATAATAFTISGLSSPSTLSSPNQLALDSAGNLYIADTGNNRVVQVSPSGSASVLSTGSYSLSAPQGVAVDASGDVFVADTGHHRIIELPSGGSAAPLSPSGITLATTTPTALAVDTYGNLYIVDVANNQVLEVNTSLQGQTVPFTSETVGTGSTSLVSPVSVTVANNGVIYITDPGASRVAVIDPQGDNYDLLMGDLVAFCGTSCFSGIGAIATNSKGTVYLANNSFSPSQVLVLQQGSADFGHVTLGSPGTTLTLNFDLSPGYYGFNPADTTVNSVAISTAGAQTADFTIANDGCAGSDGDLEGSCTVNVQFTPTAAGLRRGALVLSFTNTSNYTYYDSGNFTVPLFGIGDAPVAALSPGVASHLSTGTLTFPQAFQPFQTAYDGAGNVYVTDGPNNRVLMVPKGGGNATVVSIPALSPSPGGLSNPTGVAIDGAGNLFIADSGNNRIVEVTAGTSLVLTPCLISPEVWALSSNTLNGGWGTSTPCDPNAPVSSSDKALATPYTFNNPQSLLIDGAGNLTVDDAGNHKLVQLAPNDYYTKDNTLALSNAFVLATGSFSLGTNSSFAVDTNEGLYISDETNNRIIHVDRFGKTSTVDFSSLSTALTTPHSVALDPMGNLYVMDAGGISGGQRIVQEIIGGTSSVVTTLPYTGAVTLGGSPNGLAVDNFGNLLVSDFGGTAGTGYLTQVNVGQSSQAFPSTAVNASSSPQTTTVTNLGDQALVFSANLTYTSNFSENASDMNLCTSATSLTVGISCDVSILFSPQSAGSLSANITVTDNTQNTLGSTQQISASGTTSGEVDFTSTRLTFSPMSPVYGQSVTITATVTDTTNSGTVPTGSVVFTDALTSTVTQESLNSSGVATLSGSQIVGSHSILAAYGGVTGTFLASQDTETLVVSKASTGTVLGLSGTTLTATITAVAPGVGIPTGTVQFKSNGTNMGSPVSLSSGVATMTVTPAVPYSFTAIYSGDSNFTGSSSNAVTTSSILTTTTVTASPTSSVYGQQLTFTATVASNSGTPTGMVSFTDLTTATTLASNVSLVSGVAIATASTLLAGSHNIRAVYSPTGNFLTSNGNKMVTIAEANSNTALVISSGTLTATVTAVAPGAGTAAGQVQFLNNGTMIGNVTLSGGIATLTVTTTPPYSFTAVYSGDANFSGSTSTAVSQSTIPTTTTVTASPSSSVYGQQLTFAATVASNGGTPTGTVTFSDQTTGTTLASNVSLTSGVATLTISTLAAGNHTLQAVYTPTGSFVTSSGAKTVTISKASTSTTLTLSGSTLTVAVVAVRPGAGTPIGAVQFLNGSTGIGNGTLSGGTATQALSLSPPYSVTAVYSGDANFLGSTSLAVAGYAPGTSTLTLTSSPNPAQLGQSVTFNATLTTHGGPPSAASGGSVQFSDGNKVSGSSSIVNGQATYATTALTGGAHIITATYSGDATFPSASATMGLIVSAPITMNITAAPSAPVYGQPVTLTVSVGATSVPAGFSAPTGQVTLFLEGSTFASSNTKLGTVTLASGTATLNLSTLPTGPVYIQGQYSGDSTWPAAARQMELTILPAATTTTVSVGMVSGQLILTGTVAPQPPGAGTPTGNVQFVDTSNHNAVVASASVAGGKATAQVASNVVTAVEGHAIAAAYSGDSNFSPSTSLPLPAATNSAANVSAIVAPDEIASLFGIPGLNGAITGTVPLGTSLGGVSVNITDSTGTTRPALLYAVSGATSQINLVIPSGTAAGPAVASITLPGGTVITTAINVVDTAPAVFTANETGQGVYSGQITYVHSDGLQTVVPSATLNEGTNSFTANPINLGTPGDEVYLALYATGLRYGSSVTVTVNGTAVPVTFFGAQPGNPGLDQVNLGPLPNSLAGVGQVNIVITVDGQVANTVTAIIQ